MQISGAGPSSSGRSLVSLCADFKTTNFRRSSAASWLLGASAALSIAAATLHAADQFGNGRRFLRRRAEISDVIIVKERKRIKIFEDCYWHFVFLCGEEVLKVRIGSRRSY
jgi:hypothetical protein